MPQRWAGKTTAHRLWLDINKYVDAYVSEHQSELESEWFRRWYDAYHNASLKEETLALHHLVQSAGHLNVMLILWFVLDHGHVVCAF